MTDGTPRALPQEDPLEPIERLGDRALRSPDDTVEAGAPLHQAYMQATTIAFLGIVACQVGTAMAARTDRVSLARVGVFSNHLLLWDIAFEIGFSAALVTIPQMQPLFGTAIPAPAPSACCSRSRCSSGGPTSSAGAGRDGGRPTSWWFPAS